MGNNRDYRDYRDEVKLTDDYKIVGYATTFDRYELFEYEGAKYFEQIDRQAFKDTDLSDVVLQFNHSGRVFCRTSNKSLLLEVDDKGLKVTADLSRTSEARSIYEDVKEKMITKMSFAFIVGKDYYEKGNNTRHITEIKKIYDCSLVDFPANSNTSVKAERSASRYVNGVLAQQSRSELIQARAQYLYTLERLKGTKGFEDYGN